MAAEPDRCWQHRWHRVSLVLRMTLGTRWDSRTWPKVDAKFKKVLALRGLKCQGGMVQLSPCWASAPVWCTCTKLVQVLTSRVAGVHVLKRPACWEVSVGSGRGDASA